MPVPAPAPCPRPTPCPSTRTLPKGASCQTSLAVCRESAYCYLCTQVACQSSACPEAEPPVEPQRPQVWPCPRNERLTNRVLSANLGAPALGTPQHQPPSAHPSAHPPVVQVNDQQPDSSLPTCHGAWSPIYTLPSHCHLPSPSILLLLHSLADSPPVHCQLSSSLSPAFPSPIVALSLGDVTFPSGCKC